LTDLSVYIGFDPREADAFAVAKSSIRKHVPWPMPIRGLVLSDLRARGLYSRPTSRREGRLWDDLSENYMSTEFACSRFLVPFIARGWLAVFMDSDMLVRARIDRIVELVDRNKAVTVVKHHFDPPEGVKMDGQAQLRYARKNWSSFMVWNLAHPANKRLTLEMVNTLPGRDLHRFCWLEDHEIGEIGPEWNWLVGHSDPAIDPKVVHFTDGIPSMPGYESTPYADEWRAELHRWAA
jgi:hypothetical protein